jgi:hypothetical protein
MKIDQSLLEAALVGYMQRRDEITAKIDEIESQLGRAGKVSTGASAREMSAAGRARIAAAQKKRWAEFHKDKGGKPAKAPKRVLSPAARKRIADATRKRWIAYRAQKAAAAKAGAQG